MRLTAPTSCFDTDADCPVGIGVEAGYAHKRDIPVICICQAKEWVANTVAGIAKHVIRCEDYVNLTRKLIDLVAK